MRELFHILRTGLLLMALIFAPSAFAGGGGGGDGDKKGESSGPTNRIQAGFEILSDNEREMAEVSNEFATPDGPYFDMPAVVAPITNNGRMIGYAFVVPRVLVSSNGAETRVRQNAHILLDAVIRAVHQTPFEDGEGRAFNTQAAHDEILVLLQELSQDGDIEDVLILGGDRRDLRI